jgi:hypothetical protein
MIKKYSTLLLLVLCLLQMNGLNAMNVNNDATIYGLNKENSLTHLLKLLGEFQLKLSKNEDYDYDGLNSSGQKLFFDKNKDGIFSQRYAFY